jgi:hypothetical protein
MQQQAQLFDTTQPTPAPFKKAVAAVHCIPTSGVTLLQRKLQNAFLKHAVFHPRDPDGFWSIPTARLREEIDFNSNNHSHLKAACEQLLRLSFDFDVLSNKTSCTLWDIANLFSRVQMRDRHIRFKLNEDLVEQIVNPSIYAQLDMAIVRQFTSATSLALYEFCIRYEGIGQTATVSYEMLCGMLLGRGKKTVFNEPKYFMYRKLKPAILEVNAVSSHTIAVVKVDSPSTDSSSYRFTVHRKATPSQVTHLDLASADAINKMIQVGMTKRHGEKLLRAHGLEVCVAALEELSSRQQAQGQAPVRSPAAFLHATIKNSFTEPRSPKPTATRAASSAGTGFDLLAAYLSSRNEEALSYYRELGLPEQNQLVDRYNAVSVPALRIKPGSKPGRVRLAAFSKWVAQDTWGDPSPDVLIKYANQVLSAPR